MNVEGNSVIIYLLLVIILYLLDLNLHFFLDYSWTIFWIHTHTGLQQFSPIH